MMPPADGCLQLVALQEETADLRLTFRPPIILLALHFFPISTVTWIWVG